MFSMLGSMRQGEKLRKASGWRDTVCDLPPLRWRSLVPGKIQRFPGVLSECTHERVNRRFAASMEGAIERPNQAEEENRNSF